jgi:hypothetical protein
MTTTTGVDHQPSPATYDCRSCERPWPCDAAREYLASTTPDTVQLGMRLWVELEQAAAVLRHEPPAVLFDRFLKWARPPAATDQPTGRTGMMSDEDIHEIAERCADALAKYGDVFIEDDEIDGLAAALQPVLREFLRAASLPAIGRGQSSATG